MTVRVRDQRNPEQSVTGSVIVDVRRNQQPPRFVDTPYTRDLSENTAVSSSVYVVRAVDTDLRVGLLMCICRIPVKTLCEF